MSWRALWTCLLFTLFAGSTGALALVETPSLAEDVAAGKLPPVAKRVPEMPLVVAMEGPDMKPGQQCGTPRMLIGRSRDVRMLVVYGCSRLVGYAQKLAVVPDLPESVAVTDGRSFTMKLREAHRWSDGAPFTTEGFR